jgi:hypothetical protein
MPMIRVMGLRILFGIVAVCCAIVLAAVVATPHRFARDVGSVTSQGVPVSAHLDPVGRPTSFDASLRTRCDYTQTPQHVTWLPTDGSPAPWAWQGRRLVVSERKTYRLRDGTRMTTRTRLDARQTDAAFAGRVEAFVAYRRAGRVTGRCGSGPVSFSIPLR